jgi:hypothetical protein
MRVAPIVGLSCALLIAACSGTKNSAPVSQPSGAVKAVASAASSTPTPSASTSSTATASSAPTAVEKPSGVTAPQATNPALAPAVVATQDASKSVSPAAKALAATKSTVAPPATKSAAPTVAKSAGATLDLASLTQRLKDTNAIGVLTKITLKNEVDDLLDQFRAFYQGKLKTTLAELRRPYDSLVLKVLTLLQDDDPALASAIVASREAIWGILADPKKFATVS